MLEYLTLLGTKPPAIITTAAEFTLTAEIVKKLETHAPDVEGIKRDFELAAFWQISPEEEQIRFAFSDCINSILSESCATGFDVETLEDLNGLIKLFSEKFNWHLSLYDAQNLYYELLKQQNPILKTQPEPLRKALYELGRSLRFSDEFLKIC